MNHLATIISPTLPALVTAAGERASTRFREFFAANIRNPYTAAGRRDRRAQYGPALARAF